jgi:hypothetical protein
MGRRQGSLRGLGHFSFHKISGMGRGIKDIDLEDERVTNQDVPMTVFNISS